MAKKKNDVDMIRIIGCNGKKGNCYRGGGMAKDL